MLAGVNPTLARSPANVLRFYLHPAGLAPRIVNLSQWRAHLLERLRRQINITADPVLAGLMHEMLAYPSPVEASANTPVTETDYAGVIVPLQLATEDGVLPYFSTTTTFGTPVDITLSELALECFYPADRATAYAPRNAAATTT